MIGISSDEIAIIKKEKQKSDIKNCHSHRSAEISSDHFLVMINSDPKLIKPTKITKAKKKYCVERLCAEELLSEDFKIKIGSAFEPLLKLVEHNVDHLYSKFINATNTVTKKVACS